MSVVNAGRVELDLVALARDEVTATLRQANRSLEGTKVQMEGVASANKKAAMSTTDFGSALGGLKEKVKPLDQVRGTFENLRSNLFAFPSMLISAAVGAATLVAQLMDAGTAAERLRVKGSEYAKALENIIKRTNELKVIAGEKIEDAAALEVGQAYVDLGEKISTSESRIRELTKTIELFKAQASAGFSPSFLGLAAIDRAQREIAALSSDIRIDSERKKEFEEQTAAAMERQVVALERQASIDRVSGVMARAFPGAFAGDPFANAGDGKGKTPPKPRGGGGMSAAQRRAKESREEMAFDLAEDFSARELSASEAKARDADDAEASREDMALRLREDFEAREAMAQRELERVEALKESYREYADIIGSVLPASYGEFIDSLVTVGELSTENLDSSEGQINMAEAVGKSVIKLGATQAKTAQHRNLWRAAEEIAEGVGAAARYDYGAAALHGVAATLHLAAAAKTGGGGSGGGGRSGAGGGGGPSALDRGGGGGATTVVYNVDVKPGTDPQSVARELTRVSYASRATGLGNPGV